LRLAVIKATSGGSFRHLCLLDGTVQLISLDGSHRTLVLSIQNACTFYLKPL